MGIFDSLTCDFTGRKTWKAAGLQSIAELQTGKVDKVSDSATDQSAIVKAKVPESLGMIYPLMRSDEGKLHACHGGSKTSLFDPSTQKLIPIEASQKGQMILDSAISPKADHMAFLQKSDEAGKNGKPFSSFSYTNLIKVAEDSMKAGLSEMANTPLQTPCISFRANRWPLPRLALSLPGLRREL